MTDDPETPEEQEGDSPRRMAFDGPTISVEDEMRRAYLDYAMSVIVARAIPDLRDGLKPVHRRILFAMHETSNTFDKAYRKAARPVGDV
ncbi:MAG: DNA gyrase subunit A, partial [Pseudomonadota bacterium]